MTLNADSLAGLPSSERLAILKQLTNEDRLRLRYHWRFWARPEQLPPELVDPWLTWLILTGRGWGKTRTGAEFVRAMVCGKQPNQAGLYKRVALVGETAADTRDVMVEGETGLLSVHPPAFRPVYEPSKRRLTWPNGAIGTLYNATEPDQLRGPQHDLAWCDELAKWRYAQDTWDMLQFGLRLGVQPRQIITTTPRPIPLLKQIMADPRTVITRGKTRDNEGNLPESFFEQVVSRYVGTRLGRQELDAEVLDDVPGSLWTRSRLDELRVQPEGVPALQRVVVAVDPAVTVGSESAAETGIVVAALGQDGRGYVLDDLSGRYSPNAWARMALSGLDLHEGDSIVVETNQGGDMVKNTLKAARSTVRVIEVRASRGKVTRAEPIAALYEQGRVSHVGSFPQLEDQMVLFTPLGIEGETTADRVDALVWAFTALFPHILRAERKQNRPIVIEGARSYNPLRF